MKRLPSPLRGRPCRRCGRPLGRSHSGYCGDCGPRVRCPVCQVQWGLPRTCPACLKVSRSLRHLTGRNAQGPKAGGGPGSEARVARDARLALYESRAHAGLPLFEEAPP